MNENKDLVGRWIEEGVNESRKSAVDRYIGNHFVGHDPYQSVALGRDGMRKLSSVLRNAFPGLQVRIDDMIAQDDFVGCRLTVTGTHRGEFMGCAPTRADVIFPAMCLWRIEDGWLCELWQQWDASGLKAQIDEASGFKSTVRASGIELDAGPGPSAASDVSANESQRNKEIAQRWMDRAWNHGELNLIDELFAEDFYFWDPSGPPATTREEFREWANSIDRGFSLKPRSLSVHELIAEDDKTMFRVSFKGVHDGEFLTSTNTGRSVGFGALILVQHASDGRFQRAWQIFDFLNLCQQIGIETRETRTLDGDIRIYTR